MPPPRFNWNKIFLKVTASVATLSNGSNVPCYSLGTSLPEDGVVVCSVPWSFFKTLDSARPPLRLIPSDVASTLSPHCWSLTVAHWKFYLLAQNLPLEYIKFYSFPANVLGTYLVPSTFHKKRRLMTAEKFVWIVPWYIWVFKAEDESPQRHNAELVKIRFPALWWNGVSKNSVSVRLVLVVPPLPMTPNTTWPGFLPHVSPSFAHPPKCVTPTSPVYSLNTCSGVHYLLVFHSGWAIALVTQEHACTGTLLSAPSTPSGGQLRAFENQPLGKPSNIY